MLVTCNVDSLKLRQTELLYWWFFSIKRIEHATDFGLMIWILFVWNKSIYFILTQN